MKSQRGVDYLGHMIDATSAALSYIDGMDKAQFLADRRTQQAVLLNIMILGEAATQLAQHAPELIANHPNVPWQSMRGMRNRVAHGYFEIDLDVVWATVQVAMPALLPQLIPIRDTLAKA